MRKLKNRKVLMSILSVIMSVVICVAATGSVPIKVYSAHIDPALEKVLSRASNTDLIPVDIWLYDIDTEEVDEKVFAKTGLSRETISDEKRSAELTHAEVDAYIEAERTIYAEAQTKRSNEFLKQYSNIFTSKATENSEVFYVSKYAPSIQMELTPDQIAKLAKDLSVESIYYSPPLMLIDEAAYSVPTIRANYTRDTLGYDGSGIKIGMLESGGPQTGQSYLNYSRIIYRNSNMNKTPHANLVASIMVSTDYGIVPNATLYCATSDGKFGTLKPNAEWLLSQGVNVINMSAMITTDINAEGNEINIEGINYSYVERWIDHIAINHSVHFVNAAGNNGEGNGHIIRPGLAFNAITVGNIDDKNNTNYADDTISSFSSYVEGTTSTTPMKPDLVAPGTCILTSANIAAHTAEHKNCGGTSFSAPHVTAIVAQLCQAKPALKTQQDAMKAILTASINHSVHHYEPSDDNYDIYGAGVVDARSAAYTANNSRYASSNFSATAENETSHYYTITTTSSDTRVRISLAWLKYAYNIGTNHTNSSTTTNDASDLDLYIYRGDVPVYSSYNEKGNVEIVEINNPYPGTYRIEVFLYNNGGSKTYYTLAWW